MNAQLGTEVDLGPGHTVLDAVPALRERGTAALPLFSAHVYSGHGRPSQLLLSSCCTAQDNEVPPYILQWGPLFAKIAPSLPTGHLHGTPCNTSFLGPIQTHNTKGISIS